MKKALEYLKGDFLEIHELQHPYVNKNVYEGSMEFIEKALEIAYYEGMFADKGEVNTEKSQVGNSEDVTIRHMPSGLQVKKYFEFGSRWDDRKKMEKELRDKIIEHIKNKK